MKDYKVENPQFTDTLQITETTDTSHADNINRAPKQAFENTLYLEKTKVAADGGDVSDTIIKTEGEAGDEDYPVPVAGDTSKTFLAKTKKFISNFKDWMTGVCMLGAIVNNCVTDNPSLPLSAAQGKALMDLYTQLYSDISGKIQFGESTITCDANSTGGAAVTFEKSYTVLPVIVASTGEDVTSPYNWMSSYISITKRERTGFTISVKNAETKKRTIFIYWIAIGK